jgi:lysophospholipase L1-like esterase
MRTAYPEEQNQSKCNNNMKTFKITLFALLLASLAVSQDTKPAFWDDIQNFKRQDAVSYPPKNAILFVGSSSFTMWKDVQEYFPDRKILNRGFGGSSLPDVIRYADDIIFPYQPKQVVIYCGENDLAGDDTITAQTVFLRFRQLYSVIRAKLPDVPVVFISLKPSPSRWNLKPKMIAVNEKIRKFLKRKKNAKFVSVWNAMLGPDGKPEELLFREDKLHMKPAGYAIWKRKLEPLLLK